MGEIKFKFKNISLWWGRRDAVIASLLAARNNYAGVVLKSGLYDFEKAYDSCPWYRSIKLSMIWELGLNNRESLRKGRNILFQWIKLSLI
jgi:hypothetical protein